MADKRYYWLKLKDDFFTSKRIKKMRKLAGGDTYTIIYLKMQLVAIKHDGKLEYSGIEPTIAEEIALDIDESVDDVKLCLSYLIGCGLAEECGDGCFFPYAVENTGSEGSAAERMRIARARARAKQRQIEEHSCNNVTQSSNGVKQIGTSFELSYGEKEKEIEIEKEKKESKRFTPPSREEVQAYCEERKNNVDADSFVDFYASKGWMVGKNPMKDWKACVRTWERRDTKKREPDRNRFNQFEQHGYDFDELEKELLT